MLALCSSFGPVDGDGAKPIRWNFDSEEIAEGKYRVIITANISDGWCIYSKESKINYGPVPTSVKIDTDTNIHVVGDVEETSSAKKVVKSNGNKLVKLMGRTVFTQEIEVNDPFQIVTGELTFMVCNENGCLPPEDMPFDIILADDEF